eukprot:359508-Chlamydomonas_euryale.AAC.2
MVIMIYTKPPWRAIFVKDWCDSLHVALYMTRTSGMKRERCFECDILLRDMQAHVVAQHIGWQQPTVLRLF